MLFVVTRAIDARSRVVQVLQDTALPYQVGFLALMTQLHQLLLETLELLHLDADNVNLVVEQVVHPLASTCRLRLEL